MKYFDLHCDTPYECYFKNQPFWRNNLAVSGECGLSFEKWRQTFAVWIKDDIIEPFELYERIITDFKEKLKSKPDNLIPIFSVEGGAVIEDDINLLYRLKDDGIKFLTLTWNGENRIAGGSKTSVGLTHFGKKVIEKMNELHMACDFSHLNVISFYDAIDLADYPIATHSNSRAICDVPRNLTDEQLKLIAQKGGIIGLCFYPPFLGGDFYEKIYENIYHMLELGLEENIAIGSDFDGADMDCRIDNISKIPGLYDVLACKNLPESILNKIFYENAEKYMGNL